MMIRRKLKLYSLLNYCPTQIAESENVKIYDRECVCWWCLAEERERRRRNLVIIALGVGRLLEEAEKISGVANNVGGSAGLGLEEALHLRRFRRWWRLRINHHLRRRASSRPLRFRRAQTYFPLPALTLNSFTC